MGKRKAMLQEVEALRRAVQQILESHACQQWVFLRPRFFFLIFYSDTRLKGSPIALGDASRGWEEKSLVVTSRPSSQRLGTKLMQDLSQVPS